MVTPWKTNMDPENHWLVEENHLPGGQDVRVYVSGLGSVQSTHEGSDPQVPSGAFWKN